jgi:hypothetical protein
MDKIIDFSKYLKKENSIGDHTTVSKGQNIKADYFNEATRDLRALGSSGVPPDVNKGDNVIASLFHALKNALNSL